MAISPRPRWRRRKDDRPAEIISAALDSFAERGFAATKLDDIAARAGVTRGTLYLYFPNKEELFKAMVRQAIVPIFAGREEMMANATEPSSVLLERLLLSIPDAVRGTRLAAIPKLVISEAGNFPDLARFYYEEVISRGRRLVTGLIARGIARGEFRPVDTDQIFFSVVAPLLVAILFHQTFADYDEHKFDLHRLCRSHVDVLLHGLVIAGERT